MVASLLEARPRLNLLRQWGASEHDSKERLKNQRHFSERGQPIEHAAELEVWRPR